MAAWRRVTLALAAATLVHPAAAFAADGDVDAAEGTTPPAAAAVEETPAPGAQPAAPANVATPAVDGMSADEAAANGIDTSREDAAAPQPVENTTHANHAAHAAASSPAVTPALASGGGTAGEDDAASFDAAGAGAAPAAAPPAGELPFTGPGDTILMIALAGMFAPIGVLLWCFARRSEMRWLRCHLAMPRFEWRDR